MFFTQDSKAAAFRRTKLFILSFAMFVEFQHRRNYYLIVLRIPSERNVGGGQYSRNY